LLIVEVEEGGRVVYSVRGLSSTNHQSPITNHQSPITNHQSSIINHQSPREYGCLAAPVVWFQPGGRHFSAGVRKPPDCGPPQHP
jgi:hypothetical protein